MTLLAASGEEDGMATPASEVVEVILVFFHSLSPWICNYCTVDHFVLGRMEKQYSRAGRLVLQALEVAEDDGTVAHNRRLIGGLMVIISEEVVESGASHK